MDAVARDSQPVVLEREHEHRGWRWPPGTRLDLRPDQARRLIARGVARRRDLASGEEADEALPG